MQPSRPEPMATETDTATARNREAQRRSRARRKAHLEELQQRVVESERQRTQATREVQVAARRVLAENGALRNMLYSRGVLHGEIVRYVEDFLRTGGEAGECNSPAPASTVFSSATTPRGTDTGEPLVPCTLGITPASLRKRSGPRRAGPGLLRELGSDTLDAAAAGDGTWIAGASTTTLDAHNPQPKPIHVTALPIPIGEPVSDPGLADNGQGTCPKSPQLSPPGPQSNGARTASAGMPHTCGNLHSNCGSAGGLQNEISCTQAARILAQLRGHDNERLVWPELGCSAENFVMVKRARILELA